MEVYMTKLVEPKTTREKVNRICGWVASGCFTYEQLVEIIARMEHQMKINSVQLDCCQAVLKPAPIPATDFFDEFDEVRLEQEEEEETTMYQRTEEETKRDYLSERLHTVYMEKDEAARRTFGLQDDERPKTIEEAVQRIKDGKYTITPKTPHVYYSTWDRLRWRDPEVKEDNKGYEAEEKELDKKYQEIKDTIMISDSAEALKTLQAWETTN
jgi:hypothetical protein